LGFVLQDAAALPPLASKAVVSQVVMPASQSLHWPIPPPRDWLAAAALRSYFSVRRILCAGDVFAVPLPLHPAAGAGPGTAGQGRDTGGGAAGQDRDTGGGSGCESDESQDGALATATACGAPVILFFVHTLEVRSFIAKDIKGALCALVIRLQVVYNQPDETLSRSSLMYMSNANFPIAVH